MAFLSFEMSRGNTYGLRCNENVGFTLHHLAPITAQDRLPLPGDGYGDTVG